MPEFDAFQAIADNLLILNKAATEMGAPPDVFQTLARIENDVNGIKTAWLKLSNDRQPEAVKMAIDLLATGWGGDLEREAAFACACNIVETKLGLI